MSFCCILCLPAPIFIESLLLSVIYFYMLLTEGMINSSALMSITALDVQMLQPGVYLLHLITAEEVLWKNLLWNDLPEETE